MKIEKFFSIRIYDGKKGLRESIAIFCRAVIKKEDLITQVRYDQESTLNRLTSGTLILLLLGSEVCAMANFHVQPLADRSPAIHERRTAWITDFTIHPDYRKIGLARMLLNVISNYSRYLGKHQLRIQIPAHSSSLNDFLQHQGFSQCIDAKNHFSYHQLNLKNKNTHAGPAPVLKNKGTKKVHQRMH